MRIWIAALMLLTACVTPPEESGRPLPVPYLHPTARLVLPEEIHGIRVARVAQSSGPLDVFAHYAAPGLALTVYVYPASMLPDPSLEAHFQAAMAAVKYQWGVETAEHLVFPPVVDPRLPALGALFEADRAPLPIGVVTVYKACSHIVKFRLSSARSMTHDQRMEILDFALDAVLPRDYAFKALQSVGATSCVVDILNSADPSRALADDCQVVWKPESGAEGLKQALCDALDAKVAAQSR